MYAAAAILVLVASACSGESNDANTAREKVRATTSESMSTRTPDAATAPTPTPLTAQEADSYEGGESLDAEPSAPPVVVGEVRELNLVDAFSAEGWEEGAHQPVAGEQAQAMATLVSCGYGYDGGDPLEFRIAQTDGYKLVAKVAQDLTSPSSTARLEFALVVDGRQVAAKAIEFNESAILEADISNAAVVKMTVKQSPPPNEDCDDAAIALVTDLTMQSK
ncbi:hypothetical protein KV102_08920 [Mumia sp. zg.B53]|uniref:hypothetical protein n=1 Tax=Mumia sp. zg.B53 TaxID=2855449 RepID=UPI001C6E8AE9|nr:hypothetical protein [Mumia sp. zg.B53]MBW9214963.1 hypothetical protein [Mumia sp. zg.B53]